MSDERDRKPARTAAGLLATEEQKRRLAAALRENLRKRKAQERARSGDWCTPVPDGEDQSGGGI